MMCVHNGYMQYLRSSIILTPWLRNRSDTGRIEISNPVWGMVMSLNFLHIFFSLCRQAMRRADPPSENFYLISVGLINEENERFWVALS